MALCVRLSLLVIVLIFRVVPVALLPICTITHIGARNPEMRGLTPNPSVTVTVIIALVHVLPHVGSCFTYVMREAGAKSKVDLNHARVIHWADPPPCHSGRIGTQVDPTVLTTVPYSHYYLVGGVHPSYPRMGLLFVQAFGLCSVTCSRPTQLKTKYLVV